jgi:hypothetical protein
MGYPAQIGFPFSVLHPVRDINGAYVANQAANLTKSLLKPDRTADVTTVVTLTDYPGVTGWVQATFTPTLLGSYLLILSNPDPPTADGRTTDYDVIAAHGIAPSQTLLTSLDRVRTRLQLQNSSGNPIQPGEPHALDSLLNMLISEVSDEYQGVLGRTFAESDYAEYLDGSGRGSLVLGAGPLVSFTSLSQVEYRDDGAGGVTEVLTLVPRHTYVLSGLRTQPRFYGLGRIDLVGGGNFARGAKNYKAVHRSGFSPIPEGVVGLATQDVVNRVLSRETVHLLSRALADGTITYVRPQQMVEARDEGLRPYLLEAA